MIDPRHHRKTGLLDPVAFRDSLRATKDFSRMRDDVSEMMARGLRQQVELVALQAQSSEMEDGVGAKEDEPLVVIPPRSANALMTTTGYVYPYVKTLSPGPPLTQQVVSVGVKPLTWHDATTPATSVLTEDIGSPSEPYIVATKSGATLTVAAASSIPSGGDLTTKRLLATLTYDGGGQLTGISRNQVSDIHPAGGNTYELRWNTTDHKLEYSLDGGGSWNDVTNGDGVAHSTL